MAATVELIRWRWRTGAGKRFTLDAGVLTKASPGFPQAGFARQELVTMQRLADCLRTPDRRDVLLYAQARVPASPFVLARQDDVADLRRAVGYPVFSRQGAASEFGCLERAAGVPCIMAIDYDGPPRAAEAVLELLYATCPGIAGAPHIVLPSASAYVGTESAPGGPGGLRVLVLVADGSDIERAAGVLHARAHLVEGAHWPFIDQTGQVHPRSIVDLAAVRLTQPDFVAPPDLGPGVTRCRPDPQVFSAMAPPLDTRAHLPDLSSEDAHAVQVAMQVDATTVQAEAHVVRAAYIEREAAAHAARAGQSIEAAREAIKTRMAAAQAGGLSDDTVLHLDRQPPITVAALRADPWRWDGATLADPLEPRYVAGSARPGTRIAGGKARIRVSPAGVIRISSVIHGGRTFVVRDHGVETELAESGGDDDDEHPAPQDASEDLQEAPMGALDDPIPADAINALEAAVGADGEVHADALVGVTRVLAEIGATGLTTEALSPRTRLMRVVGDSWPVAVQSAQAVVQGAMAAQGVTVALDDGFEVLAALLRAHTPGQRIDVMAGAMDDPEMMMPALAAAAAQAAGLRAAVIPPRAKVCLKRRALIEVAALTPMAVTSSMCISDAGVCEHFSSCEYVAAHNDLVDVVIDASPAAPAQDKINRLRSDMGGRGDTALLMQGDGQALVYRCSLTDLLLMPSPIREFAMRLPGRKLFSPAAHADPATHAHELGVGTPEAVALLQAIVDEEAAITTPAMTEDQALEAVRRFRQSTRQAGVPRWTVARWILMALDRRATIAMVEPSPEGDVLATLFPEPRALRKYAQALVCVPSGLHGLLPALARHYSGHRKPGAGASVRQAGVGRIVQVCDVAGMGRADPSVVNLADARGVLRALGPIAWGLHAKAGGPGLVLVCTDAVAGLITPELRELIVLITPSQTKADPARIARAPLMVVLGGNGDPTDYRTGAVASGADRAKSAAADVWLQNLHVYRDTAGTLVAPGFGPQALREQAAAASITWALARRLIGRVAGAMGRTAPLRVLLVEATPWAGIVDKVVTLASVTGTPAGAAAAGLVIADVPAKGLQQALVALAQLAGWDGLPQEQQQASAAALGGVVRMLRDGVAADEPASDALFEARALVHTVLGFDEE